MDIMTSSMQSDCRPGDKRLRNQANRELGQRLSCTQRTRDREAHSSFAAFALTPIAAILHGHLAGCDACALLCGVICLRLMTGAHYSVESTRPLHDAMFSPTTRISSNVGHSRHAGARRFG